VIGQNLEVVFPSVVFLLGVLPAMLAYKFGAFLRALGGAVVVGAVGWILWGTGHLTVLGSRPIQATAFALFGFLAVLLPLGMRGGAKRNDAK
jgi:hypothetical protein